MIVTQAKYQNCPGRNTFAVIIIASMADVAATATAFSAFVDTTTTTAAATTIRVVAVVVGVVVVVRDNSRPSNDLIIFLVFHFEISK